MRVFFFFFLLFSNYFQVQSKEMSKAVTHCSLPERESVSTTSVKVTVPVKVMIATTKALLLLMAISGSVAIRMLGIQRLSTTENILYPAMNIVALCNL